LDDLLGDLFERDGRRREPGERRGLRGFFGRLFDGGEDDDERQSEVGRDGRRRRERDRDGAFDWD
jgi:hypothetical protein